MSIQGCTPYSQHDVWNIRGPQLILAASSLPSPLSSPGSSYVFPHDSKFQIWGLGMLSSEWAGARRYIILVISPHPQF